MEYDKEIIFTKYSLDFLLLKPPSDKILIFCGGGFFSPGFETCIFFITILYATTFPVSVLYNTKKGKKKWGYKVSPFFPFEKDRKNDNVGHFDKISDILYYILLCNLTCSFTGNITSKEHYTSQAILIIIKR